MRSVKKGFRKNLAISQENTCVGVSLRTTLLKRDSNTFHAVTLMLS